MHKSIKPIRACWPYRFYALFVVKVVIIKTKHDGLDKADIGEGAIIAAGAVVLQGTHVPAHEIWGGIPAKKVKDCAPGQAETFAQHYAGYIKDWYREEE